MTQTVIGTPGVYDPKRNAIALTGGLAGWDRPAALAGLREAFGPSIALENDVDAAALAERTHGYGRDRESFAFVHVGTGIGMGLVLDGRLHRGVHGVAGEIAFMPLAEDASSEAQAPGAARGRRGRVRHRPRRAHGRDAGGGVGPQRVRRRRPRRRAGGRGRGGGGPAGRPGRSAA